MNESDCPIGTGFPPVRIPSVTPGRVSEASTTLIKLTPAKARRSSPERLSLEFFPFTSIALLSFAFVVLLPKP